MSNKSTNKNSHVLGYFFGIILVLIFYASWQATKIPNVPPVEKPTPKQMEDAVMGYTGCLLNTEGIVAYCKDTPYSMEDYVKVFDDNCWQAKHVLNKELEKISQDISESKKEIDEEIMSSANKHFDNELELIKKDNPAITKADFCRIMNENSESMFRAFLEDIKERVPEVYQKSFEPVEKFKQLTTVYK